MKMCNVWDRPLPDKIENLGTEIKPRNSRFCYMKNLHKKQRVVSLSAVMILLVSTALAVVTRPFSNWGNLQRSSSDTFVAQCTKTAHFEETPIGIFETEMKVLSVLKGVQPLGMATLRSTCRPLQEEYYLIFAQNHGAAFQAAESYRVIPLGMDFSTNVVAGKKLDEQIQLLLEFRLHNVERQLKELQEEKVRLEQGVRKQ